MVCVHSLDGAGVRARRVAVSVLAAAAIAAGAGVGVTLPAHAATVHRAAVVVEVDGVIHTGKVTFSTDSINGIDALRSAGFNPLVRVFGPNGGAVCALDVGTTTIGCPADTSCLTCAAPDYWAYFRAPAGATQYTYSRTGAGLTQVHDGDVEAWAWGTGSPPSPFVSFRDVWGPDPTTTTRPPPTTRPTPTTSHPRLSPTTVGVITNPTATAPPTVPPSWSGGATTTAPKAKAGAATTKPRPPSSTISPTTNERGAPKRDVRKVATAPVVARGGGGSPYGLLGFAAVLAALLAAIVVVRRRRTIGSEPA
jgi:hypothetical protein